MFPAQLIPVSLLVAWKHQYYPYLRAIRIKGLYGTHQYRLSPYRKKLFGKFASHAQTFTAGYNQNILHWIHTASS